MCRQTTGELGADLAEAFQTLHDKPPRWAWPFSSSIPLIGERHQLGKSLLIYAGAENFTWLNRTDIPERHTSDAAWGRYRVAYEDEGRYSGDFFPFVGIQPVTDGGLSAAGLFIAGKVGLPVRKKPRTFLETLAVSNWCKFAIRTKRKNREYISDHNKPILSLSFVVAELSALRPGIVMLPKVLWRNVTLRAAMRGASPWTRFVPAPQFNTTVVNCHLAKHAKAADRLYRQMRGSALAEWMQHLTGFNEENAWRFLVLLDEAL